MAENEVGMKSSEKNPELLMLTQYFYPDMASTGLLLTELAEDLVGYGCDIMVYTAQPTYVLKTKARNSESYRGIAITRLFSTTYSKNTKAGKVLNAFSFFLSVLFRLLSTPREVPLLIVSNPPFLAFAGVVMKKLKGQRYIYLVHDVYPDVAVKLGFFREGGLVATLWDRVNRTIFTNADRIVVLGQCMKELVEGKLDNKCKEKVINIPNWADGEYIRPIQKEDNWFAKEHSLVDKTVVLHSGNMGLGHQLETVIEAAKMLKAEDIVFLFIGDGGKRTKLERMVSERGLGNVMFLPYQPYRDLPYSISCSDITVVALEKGIEGICVPCKLYAFMATGRPVIGLLGQQSETARVIDASGCGYRFDQDDVEGFANAVLYLHKNKTEAKSMGMRAREYFDRNFTRQRISRQYYELLKGLERP